MKYKRFAALRRFLCQLLGHRWESIEHAGDKHWGRRCTRCGATLTPTRGFQEFGQ